MLSSNALSCNVLSCSFLLGVVLDCLVLSSPDNFLGLRLVLGLAKMVRARFSG